MERIKYENLPVIELQESDYFRYYEPCKTYIGRQGECYDEYGHRLRYRRISFKGDTMWFVHVPGGMMEVNSMLYQAFNPNVKLKGKKVVSALNNEWLIENGYDDEPDFSVDDLYLVDVKKERKKTIKVSLQYLEELSKRLSSAIKKVNVDEMIDDVKAVQSELEWMVMDEWVK